MNMNELELFKSGELMLGRCKSQKGADGLWTIEWICHCIPGGHLGSLVLDTMEDFVPFVQEATG